MSTEQLLDHFASWLRSSLKLNKLQENQEHTLKKLGAIESHFGRFEQQFSGLLAQQERTIMTLRQEFKDAIEPLTAAFKAGLLAEGKNAELLVKVQGLEESLASATGTIEDFKAENAAEIAALTALLALPVSPVADAIATEVITNPEIPTPAAIGPLIVAAPEEATPVEQSGAAIDAIVDALPDSE